MQSKIKNMSSLFKNSVFNFFSQAIIFLSALIFSVLLARFLGPEQMGEYSYLMWLIGTGALLLTLGLPRTLVRFVSDLKSKNNNSVTHLISRTFLFQLKLLTILTIFTLLLIFILNPESKLSYFYVTLTLLVVVLNSMLGSALFGLQKYGALFRINFLTSVLSLTFGAYVLFFAENINNLLLANFLVLTITFSISLFSLKNYLNFKSPPLNPKIFKEIKAYTLSVSAIVFLDLILMERSEIFFLKNFSTIEQVAFYSISFGLVGRVMTLIPGAVSGVIMPKIAWLHGKKESANIDLTYYSSTRYLSLLTLPIIFAGLVLIDLPVNIFYGYQYRSVIPVIQILLISGGLSAIVAAAAAVLYGTGGQKFILKLAASAAVVNILFDIMLIPNWGAVGAAAANFIAQILGVITGTFYLVRIKKMPFPFQPVLKILTAASVSAIFIFSLKARFHYLDKLTLLISLSLVYIIIYFIVLLSLKFFIKQDSDVIRKITDKIKFPK